MHRLDSDQQCDRLVVRVRKVISLYTGAGGLDLGFEAAGFDVAVAVELDAEAVTTLRRNRDWPVIDPDIHDVSSKEILAAGGLGTGEADVLIGGPPCQPFSKSGYWANGDSLRLDDPRAGTVAAYLRVLRDTLPRAFFLENVPGLAYRGKSEGIELIQRTIEAINCECKVDYCLGQAAQCRPLWCTSAARAGHRGWRQGWRRL
jgi:DNA (cytosine-5)-methyltransferase 1